MSSFKRKLITSLKKPKITNDDDDIEGRIINSKVKIYSNVNSYENDGPTKFTLFSHHDNNKNVKFNNNNYYEQNDESTESVRFENNENNKDSHRDIFRVPSFNRKPQQVNFQEENNQYDNQLNRPAPFFPGDSSNTFHRQQAQPTKMIFPDRTGTGNLKFDNRDFESPLNSNRIGKILNYGNNNRYQPSFSGSNQNNPNQISFGDKLNTNNNNNNYNNDNYNNDHFTFNQRPANTYSSQQQQYQNQHQQQQPQQEQSTSYYRPSTNYYQPNRYSNQNQNYNSQNRPTYYPSNNRYSVNNRNREDNSSQNVYITNSKGVTEYYINAQGKKVYV